MNWFESLKRRLKLRHFLFLLMLLAGIVPLALSSLLLIGQNKEILVTQEKSYLTRSAQTLSDELGVFLASSRRQLDQLGETLLAVPGAANLDQRLRQEWVLGYLQRFLESNPEMLALRVLTPEGVGPAYAPAELGAAALGQLDAAFDEARQSEDPVYRFVPPGPSGEAAVAVALRKSSQQAGGLVVEGLLRLKPMEELFQREAQGDVAVFLLDRSGELLWWEGADEATARAVEGSQLVKDFRGAPFGLTREYSLQLGAEEVRLQGRVSPPVLEAGWGVLVHRPVASAFAAVREMYWNTALSSAVLLGLALVIAALAARTVSRPIQELSESTREIAAGNLGRRVKAAAPARELTDLADSFNRMSAWVQSYVDQLRDAARANRELFIGSIRAFVATIDAKDPYTRGHSERVASYSRTIGRFLGLSDEQQSRLWLGALIHDVGKIGIEDRILQKGEILTEEEYEQMKLHTVIGAQIMSRIDQLKEMVPTIRSHHEAWNGRGYPDGLRGEQIPLMARITAVADSFDAITTDRPYKKAYEPRYAVETIATLAGTRFDAKVVSAFLQAFEEGEIDPLQRPQKEQAADPGTLEFPVVQ